MLKLLVADDEFYVRYGIKESIEWDELGIELVAEACDAEEAYEMYAEYRPNIIITDICMEDTSGLDLIERIRKEDDEVEFIILTGYAKFEYAKQALKFGVTNYMLKPFRNEELISIVTDIKERFEKKHKMHEQIHDFYENINFLKDKFIADIITNKIEDEEIILAKFKRYDMQLPKDMYCLLTLCPKELEKSADIDKQLEVCLKECLNSYPDFYGVVCTPDRQSYVVLFYHDGTHEDLIVNLCGTIKEKFASISRMQINIGISGNYKKISCLYRAFEESKASVNEKENNCRKEVKQALDFIHSNYTKPISVEDIANEICVSASYLMRIFKQDTGKSVIQYITAYRMEKAKKMIVSHAYKIYEVGEMVGYKDIKHFRRLFKDYTGVTPKDYEKKH